MIRKILLSLAFLAALLLVVSTGAAASKKTVLEPQLTEMGQQIEAKYAAVLAELKAEIAPSLPVVSEPKKAALEKAREATKAAQKKADVTKQALGKIGSAKALVEHAKGKWIGGAEKGIAQAKEAQEKATTATEREVANQDLTKWLANKEDGLKALKERQMTYEQLKSEEPKLIEANRTAQAALVETQAREIDAVKAILVELTPVLAEDKWDAELVKCALLDGATPHGLASFAQQGSEQQALVEKLLADGKLMKEMLIAGGARGGKYGRAIQIYTEILKVSPKAADGVLQRLALATSLEHAVPIKQSNAKDQTQAPDTVDPVKRYLHYEKAYLEGELDPAFKDFSVWEYRMVVNCDAPDEILEWGREMLRTYRPDHITDTNYGWRYVAAVKTDVRYGSQDVGKDLPSLNPYQNIPMNGGVCGRRAFFGRFILRSFGIPVWGVTQHKHAAVSHWTPDGWVVNLGAGFHASWWDKDDAPRSGSDFLLETQARKHGQDYLKVLRAQWISRALAEETFNDRRQMAGGFWSQIGHHQSVILASTAIELGPLGQELAESNEPKAQEMLKPSPLTEADRNTVLNLNGTLTLPAVAHVKPSGSFVTMKSFSGGTQLYGKGGYKAQHVFTVPQAGRYALTTRVASFQDGQTFQITANQSGSLVEVAMPFTVGLWHETSPIEISLVKGQNVLDFVLPQGRGVTLKDFTLKPIR